jgi:hypothetical protein
MIDEELPRFSINRITDGSSMRVLYLLGEKTELQWKRYLYRRDKMHDKNEDMTDLINLFITVIRDILRRLTASIAEQERNTFSLGCPADTTIKEYDTFQDYIIQQTKIYKNIYSGNFPKFI